MDTNTSNSGIVFRFPDPGNDFSITTNQGYEVDIIGSQTGQIIDPPTLHRLPKLVKLKLGEWNECEVTVIGHQITVKLNGQTVNRCSGKRALQGYLGLQNWKGEGSVHFRNVEIRNLSPNETANSAMKAPTP